jgi:hypothetical protein
VLIRTTGVHTTWCMLYSRWLLSAKVASKTACGKRQEVLCPMGGIHPCFSTSLQAVGELAMFLHSSHLAGLCLARDMCYDRICISAVRPV